MPVLVLMLIVVAAAGSGLLVAFLGWMLHRIKQVESGGVTIDLTALEEQIDLLRDELGATRDEVADLQERLDFTERLLSDGSRKEPGA